MRSNTLLLAYCLIGGFFIFAPIVGLVFPEFALFYKLYGNAGHPSISFTLNSFFGFSGGWYRPVSFALAPFLLGIDFLNPSSIVIFNIIFFSLAAYYVSTAFLTNAGFFIKLLAASFIITAPALQSVSYFPVIDSLYVIFGLMTILALDKAYQQKRSIISIDYFLAFLFLLLAAASKEVGVLAPLIAPAVILLRQSTSCNKRISWGLVKSVVLYCLPLIIASVVYYALYVLNKGVSSSASGYSTVPVFEHLWKINQFLTASLNISYPASDNAWIRWITGSYDTIDSHIRISLYVITLLITSYGLIKRQFSPVISFAALLICLAVPLGLFHVHPHHTFPVVVALAIGVAASLSRLDLMLSYGHSFKSRVFSSVLLGLLLICSIALMYRAHVFNTQILSKGLHGPQLRYNTSLFHDRMFRELIQKKASYVLVEECPSAWAIGSSSGVLQYFARSNNSLGEEYVPKGSLFISALNKKNEIEKEDGQLIGLECRPESIPPYKVVDFSEVNLADRFPPLQLGERTLFNQSGAGVPYLVGGWSAPEVWGTWSDGSSASIALPLHSERANTILIEAKALLSPSHPKQDLEIKINGVPAAKITVTGDSGGQFEVQIPEEVQQKLTSASLLKLDFNFPDAARPKEIGINDDDRKLAIGLVALTIR